MQRHAFLLPIITLQSRVMLMTMLYTSSGGSGDLVDQLLAACFLL